MQASVWEQSLLGILNHRFGKTKRPLNKFVIGLNYESELQKDSEMQAGRKVFNMNNFPPSLQSSTQTPRWGRTK